MVTKKKILQELKTVIDPEFNSNIVDLGLIYKIEIGKSGKVKITMTLTSPGCPLSMVFEAWISDAVKKVDGVKAVMINLVWEPRWNSDKISDDVKEEMGIIK